MIVDRLFRANLALDGDGRTLSGYALPFDTETEVDDGEGPYVESFTRGAFRQVVKAPFRVKLRYEHNDDVDAWVGRGKTLREDARGLFSEWLFDDPNDARQTPRRRDALSTLIYKVADGQLPALSVSFVPGQTDEHVRDGRLHRVRRRVKMIDHVALVPEGAYPMLEPLALRHKTREPSAAQRWADWRNDYLARVSEGRTLT